jgi:DNA-binding HxlR family transcriptional regulator
MLSIVRHTQQVSHADPPRPNRGRCATTPDDQLDQDHDLSEDPIALALEVFRSRSGFLVMRQVFHGVGRFDDLRRALGITAASLSARLKVLVAAGLLERVPYQEPGARTRDRYQLTTRGRALLPVLVALAEWGAEHLLDAAGQPFVHDGCGAPVGTEVRCRRGHRVELEGLREAGTTRP